jgi:hypothetical protein
MTFGNVEKVIDVAFNYIRAKAIRVGKIYLEGTPY